MSDRAECTLCFNTYEEELEARVPRLLPCGHTFCNECLGTLALGRSALECPNRCGCSAPLGGQGVSSFPRNFALIDAMRARRPPAGGSSELARLEEEKRAAVEAEDYEAAKRLKAEIDQLKAGPGPSCTAYCYDLGAQGTLLRIQPASGAVALPWRRPRVVCVLDRSPSMGQTVQWAVNFAMPEALDRLGYQAEDPVHLITFDSAAERVRVSGRDPTVGELRQIDVKKRGSTTLMAQAVHLLGNVLSEGGAFNVFVISDGFLKDMVQTQQMLEAQVSRVSPGSRVAFALFRFFNGAPPDTQALAAAASLGNVGGAPCTDCIVRRDVLQTAMEDFVTTSELAFTAAAGKHVALEGSSFRRLPEMNGTRRVEIPCGCDSLFLVDSTDALRVNGLPITVTECAESERAIADFCNFALSQLRLWLVGRARHEDFERATQWFRQLPRAGSASHSLAGVLGRAQALLCVRADGESPLARIEALADARTFVAELNSKQQGDFLRGASVARADRLLLRRGLGSDIVYHDAVRRAIANSTPSDSNQAPSSDREAPHVSCFGGSQYVDVLNAAALLAPVAEDLSAAEVLEVVGGLGVPFSGKGRPNDPWSWEISGLDVGSLFLESDVWAADREGGLRLANGDRVTGVVPLATCDSHAHNSYCDGLQAVAFLQAASQLRGALPVKAWGWNAPPFSLMAAAAAREAAALCFLATHCFGGERKPSEAEAALASNLRLQLRSWPEAEDAFGALVAGACARGFDARSAPLRHWAAALAAKQKLSCLVLRSLCDLDVRCNLCDNGDSEGLSVHAVDVRCAVVIDLLAEDPAALRTEVTSQAVTRRLALRLDPEAEEDSRSIANPAAIVASNVELGERCKALRWLRSRERVLGVARIQLADCDAMSIAAAPPLSHDILFEGGEVALGGAFLATSVASAILGRSFDVVGEGDNLREELHLLLHAALEADYEARLNKEVNLLLLERRERIAERSASSTSEVHKEVCLEDIIPQTPANWGSRRGQPHISFVFCGASGSGKSTAAGRLLYEIGCLSRRDMQHCVDLANKLGKGSQAFAFALDKMKQERERGISISVSKRDFFSDRWHCTIIDCPGKQYYLRNTLIGFTQADVGVLFVSADSSASELVKWSPQIGQAQGVARQHARSLFAYGVSQLVVCVTKMDARSVLYSEARFNEVVGEVREMLSQVGWTRDVLESGVAFVPLALMEGGNVLQPSTRMPWWKGCVVRVGDAERTIHTLATAVNDAVVLPERSLGSLRMPVTGLFKIKGVGDVVTGHISRGAVEVGQSISYRFGTQVLSAKVASCEMHHVPHEHPSAGDIVGFALKGLARHARPRVGDVLYPFETPPPLLESFTAVIQLLPRPSGLPLGWTPLCHAHSARVAVRMTKVQWATHRHGTRTDAPDELLPGDRASVEFTPLGPLVLEIFEDCKALGRILLVDSNVEVAVGRVQAIQTRR